MTHHRRGLRRLLRDDALLASVESDFESADLGERRLAMLRHAVKLTRTPAQMRREDVELLRAAGFTDTDVLAITEVTAYYAYANRMADGLGIQVETDAEDTPRDPDPGAPEREKPAPRPRRGLD